MTPVCDIIPGDNMVTAGKMQFGYVVLINLVVLSIAKPSDVDWRHHSDNEDNSYINKQLHFSGRASDVVDSHGLKNKPLRFFTSNATALKNGIKISNQTTIPSRFTFTKNRLKSFIRDESSEHRGNKPARARTRRHTAEEDGPVHRCGGWINDTRGAISSPNFPERFPVPLRCQWIINAPPGKKIMLYFTQFYLREAFHVAEYELYSSEDFYVGKEDLGEISFDEITWLMGFSDKPYMVITFDVWEMGNIHLRVKNFLLDVYGFNITYEIIDEKEEVKDDSCSVIECSFLGNCIASHDFKYQCQCFDGYYGNECQYGPYCDPELQINMCKNGGMCRYFSGSTVNTCECPPMYEGPQCEIEKADYVDSVCKELECSQICIQDDNENYLCTCRYGYKLSPDGKTCESEGRMRYYIQIRLNAGGDSSLTCTNVQDAFLAVIHSEITDLAHGNVTVIGFRRMDEYIYIDFYFMGLKANKDDIWLIMQSIVYQTSLCSLSMDSGYLVFDAQPAPLHLITLRNYDNKPSIEGHLLTLFCKARGSRHLTFQWYKDDYLIDVHKTDRNIWASKIPTYDGETHISVLNIEKVHSLDKGEFTCIVSDWDETDSKSLHVVVIPRPHMEVSPMAITTLKNTETAISCLSRDDDTKTAQFEYIWEIGGLPLVPGKNNEIVEDMLPSGSRLKLTARLPAVYTCIVRSQAGETAESCVLSILQGNSTGRTCQAEYQRDVRWQTTLADHIERQPCPPLSEGKAKRRCTCKETTCEWNEPNFSKCVTIHLDSIAQSFERLKLGYQTSNLAYHLYSLTDFLVLEIENKTDLMSGDLDKATAFLLDIQQYIHRFAASTDKPYLYDELFSTLDIILDLCFRITQEEITELNITSNILGLVENTRRDLIFMAASFRYQSRHLDIEVQLNPLCVSHTLNLYSSHTVHIWIENNTNLCEVAVSSFIINYQVFGRIMDISIPDHYRNSDLVYVGLQSRGYDVRGLQLYIRQQNHAPVVKSQVNKSVCAMWEPGMYGKPRWSVKGCATMHRDANYTTCKCILPGHFTVFSQAVKPEIIESMIEMDTPHMPLLICAVIGLCGIITNLAAQLIFWRQSVGENRMLSLSFVLSLIGICGLLLRGITSLDEDVLCLVLSLVLYFLTLVALCTRLAEVVSLYEKSLNKSVHCVYLKPFAAFVDVFISFGIPLIGFLPILIVGRVNGYSHRDGLFCWIQPDDWEFYGLVIPVGVLLTVFVLLMYLTGRNHYGNNNTGTLTNKPRFKFYLVRCAVSQTLLCCVIVTSFLFNHYKTTLYEWLLGLLLLVLALFATATYCPKALMKHAKRYVQKKEPPPPCSVCSDQETTSCLGDCSSQCLGSLSMTHTTSHSSFKVFVRPQYNNCSSVEVDSEEACNRDKIRYTKEKREQLVAMLGQSSGSDGSTESHVTTASLSTSPDNETEDTFDDEMGFSSKGSVPSRRSVWMFVLQNKQKNRHNANSLCACSKCGTRYPFKPARGRSLIALNNDTANGTVAHIQKNASYSGVTLREQLADNSTRRQSMPNPFPELSEDQILNEINDNGKACKRMPLDRSNSSSGRKKRRTSNNSRVKFQLGDGDYATNSSTVPSDISFIPSSHNATNHNSSDADDESH